MELQVAAADAVDDGDVLRRLALLGLEPALAEHLLELERGDHVGQLAVAVVRDATGVELLVAGGDDHAADVDGLVRDTLPSAVLRMRVVEVADEAVDGLDLGLEQHLDVAVLDDARDALGQHVARRVEVGSGEVDAGDVAAQVVVALDEVDLAARVRQVERRGHARDAAADHERARAHVDRAALERLVLGDAQDGGAGERLGLLGRAGRVVVHPAALLADVGHLEEVGVDAGLLQRLAEGRLVHPRAAGGDHDPVQPVLLDVLDDHLLAGVGAHVLVGPRHGDAGQGGGGLHDGVAVDDLGDVGAAVADVDADLADLVHAHPPITRPGPRRAGSAALSLAGLDVGAHVGEVHRQRPVGEVRPLAERHLEGQHRHHRHEVDDVGDVRRRVERPRGAGRTAGCRCWPRRPAG